MKKVLYVALLGILVYASHGKALQFTFWKDDWFYLWNELYVTRLLTPILLHPGTFIELRVFGRIFSEHPYFWQVLGLFIKIAASVSVALLTFGVTRSKKASALAGVFFAASSAGLEATIWVSAHVTNILVIFLSLGTYYLFQYLRNAQPKILIISVALFIMAIADDPIRAAPVLGLFVYVYFFLASHAIQRKLQSFLPLAGVLVFIGGICLIIARDFILNTPILRFLATNSKGVSGVVSRIHLVGQYFHSLFSLMTNWVIPPAHYVNEASHGLYNPLFARLGLLILVLIGIWCVLMWRKNRMVTRRVVFFLLWMLLFYLTNWLSEPRIIATGNHRFLTVSNAGFVALVAYGLTGIRSTYIAALCAAVFLFANMTMSRHQLSELYAYRSAQTVDAVWKQIDNETSKNVYRKVFMLTGDEPANTNIFVISGATPFALLRKLSHPEDIPVVTNDPAVIARMICDSNTLSLTDVYAWEIHNDGTLINQTDDVRLAVQKRMFTICPGKSYTRDK